MAKKKGFDLKNTATFIGFLVALIVTIVFNFYIGAIAAVIVIVLYLIIDSKNVSNAGIGALVGFLIGILVHWILYALGVVLVNI